MNYGMASNSAPGIPVVACLGFVSSIEAIDLTQSPANKSAAQHEHVRKGPSGTPSIWC
jgi:hypothetical protein